MKRPNSTQLEAEAEKIRRYWQKEGFSAQQSEVDHYPKQVEQHFDGVRALQSKNESAGYYTLHDAVIRLAQSHGKTAEWWRSRMCADWLQGRLKMRDGSAWMTIDPPARPTDPKKLREWEAAARFGASGMNKMLDPHHYPHPDSLDVVAVSDLDEWLRPMGYTFSALFAEPTPSAEPAIDFALLAKRDELISAFGKFTGMNAKWFKNLRDRPKLLAARKVKGTGGRNYMEPLFCPYEVMQWLTTKPRQGDQRRYMSTETGWRMLKAHFLKVYCTKEFGDPNSD